MGKQRAAATMKRFAVQLERLAYECVEGTAPPLIAYSFSEDGQHCALGETLARMAIDGNPWTAFAHVKAAVHLLVPEEIDTKESRNPCSVLIDANNFARPHERHGAVVFPLLALADSARRVARKATPPAARKGGG